ncbi:MAG: hypothetical protein VX683_06910 [Cyanobacteriota bacterium]|nr:hypothetical protein [Cyanobacteriota bacterium]
MGDGVGTSSSVGVGLRLGGGFFGAVFCFGTGFLFGFAVFGAIAPPPYSARLWLCKVCVIDMRETPLEQRGAARVYEIEHCSLFHLL